MKGGDELFRWLVQYHVEENLPECYKQMNSQGQVCSPKNGKPYREKAENKLYHGFLIVANGNTLPERLKKDEMIKDKDIEPFRAVPSYKQFLEYLRQQDEEDNDGGYIFNSIERMITRVYEFNNNPSPGMLAAVQQLAFRLLNGIGVKKSGWDKKLKLEEMVPRDFVSFDESIPATEGYFGLRTRVAIRVPQMYHDTEGFIAKHSAYANTRTGKVVNFDRNGLVQEVSFHYDPSEKVGPFVNRERHIVALYRGYRDEQGHPTRDAERNLVPFIESLVNSQLRDAQGRNVQELMKRAA